MSAALTSVALSTVVNEGRSNKSLWPERKAKPDGQGSGITGPGPQNDQILTAFGAIFTAHKLQNSYRK